MNNAVLGKTMENMRKPRDIKGVLTERRRNYLVSEPNYHTAMFVTENLLAIDIKKDRYLWISLSIRLSIIELSKILIYDFWYYYVKPKYGEKAELCYMYLGSFIVYIKT